MPADEIREKLNTGAKNWNLWRQENNLAVLKRPLETTDFLQEDYSKYNFSRCDFTNSELRGRDFSNANFRGAILNDVDFASSEFAGATFHYSQMNRGHLNLAKFQKTNFRSARISNCSTVQCDFSQSIFFNSKFEQSGFLSAKFDNTLILRSQFDRSHFTEASFLGARINNSSFLAANMVACNFSASKLMRTDFSGAFLTGAIFTASRIERCRIYAASIWDVELTNAKQRSLVVTPHEASDISVDNMEVANFIYLLSHSAKLRNVIDTITSKVVLILGSFSSPHKRRLDAISDWLSEHDFVPVIFDFERPSSRDTSETVGLLARMAKFVIADITNPRSIPQELTDIVEKLPSVDVYPIIAHGEHPYGMYDHIKKYSSVHELVEFNDQNDLVDKLAVRIIQG